jgi:hypothetical protein
LFNLEFVEQIFVVKFNWLGEFQSFKFLKCIKRKI